MSSDTDNQGGQPGLCLGPNELKFFLQGLHSDILKDVDSKLIRAIDGLLMELEHRQKKTLQNGLSEKHKPKQKVASLSELPPKEFVCRNSTLTDLWQVTHLRAVYNFCMSLLVLLYLNIVLLYYIDYDRLVLHLSTIAWTFSKFHIVTLVWFAMMGSILFVLYPTFRYWASSRSPTSKAGVRDCLFLVLFVVFQLALLILPGQVVIQYDVPIVSSFIILAEQTRLMMKCHAFVRENAAKALKYKPHEDGDEKDTKPYPEPGSLLYFLFAPTLVYRDSYPRTPYIRWGNVAKCFLQVFGCIFGGYIPVMLFVVDTFKNFGKEPMPLVNFIGVLTVSVFAGGFLMLLTFYGMFHCWLNAFAEMLRFGDRMFYQDWWNCTSFAKYYKSWNMVVYDWLYSYIYRDMYTLLGKRRVPAMLIVFLVSGVIHEYILAICFKFAFPLLFILFLGFGVILVFITRKRTSAAWNVFLWASMFQGWGLLTVFYSAEWFARMNCPRILDSWLDYVIPRSFTCNLISVPS